MEKVRMIDLSVPIRQTPPESPLKVDIQYFDHKEGAKVFGPLFGLREEDFPEGNFSAVENLTLTTHSGTHLDAPWHYWPTSEGKTSRTIDEIPLEWCYRNGVVLDLTHKKPGDGI
ncbi:MAG: cyclase family protein, partial [Pseudomonadota bacterium]